MTNVTKRTASTLFVVLLLLAGLPVPAAAREGEQPASISASLRYQVTFVARACDAYQSIMRNRVLDNRVEAATAPGRDNVYRDGQTVDPGVEAANSAGCSALPGWRFSLGPGQEKKGALSTVTTPAVDSGATVSQVPLLDGIGRKTDKLIDGAVTTQLTEEQVRAATRRQLWVQGGTPGEPLPQGHGFGALRCASDGRTGGNVQWIGFPAGVRHVFCYAYYVRSAQVPGTLVVKARTATQTGHQQRFPFDASASYTADKRIWAAATTDATLVRSSGGAPATVVSRTPAGWTLTDVTCAKSGAGRSLTATDLPTATATVTLAAGEVVTCTFTYAPPVAPPGLTLRLFGDAAGGAFSFSVAEGGGAGAPRILQAAPAGDGSATLATGADLSTLLPGAYPVTLTAPVGEAAAWSLTGVGCGATEIKPEGLSATVLISDGAPADCTFRVTRKYSGGIELRSVTVGGLGAASFSVVPRNSSAPAWGGVATTTGLGVAALAQGDVPAALPPGEYVVTPMPPAASVEGSWRLSSFQCDPGLSQDVPNVGADIVPLTAAEPAARCTATYMFEAAHQLQITVRFAGSTEGRGGPVVLDVACTDGSTGRVVLAEDNNTETMLPEPLGFLDATKCTVERPSTPVATGATVSVTASLDPAPGNAPLSMPGLVEVGGDVEDYTVTVTVTFTAVEGEPTQQKVIDTFKLLPVALIGAGLVGIGLVILLIMVLRSRTD